MVMIDELEQKQLRCLCGEKAAQAHQWRRIISHITTKFGIENWELKTLINAKDILTKNDNDKK